LRVLITGVSGFIGRYLSKFLEGKGFDVYGTFYNSKSKNNSRLLQCDIRSFTNIHQVIQKVKPVVVYHLAAQSQPVLSWRNPWLTMEVNVLGTINLFESIKKSGSDSRVIVACSSAEYGRVSESETPIKEDCPLRSLSPYAVSKATQDLLAYQYFENFGLDTVRVRIFGTTGPGKDGDVCSDFAKRIVAIEKGLMDPCMNVGNIETRRDLTDVRDMIRALWLISEKGAEGDVYNACSGQALRISGLLEIMLSYSHTDMTVKVDKSLLRPSDEPIILGDYGKLKALTGWTPEIPIEQTLKDILEYWRSRQTELLENQPLKNLGSS